MATRRQIREAFYAELESAVPASGNSGHVPADQIGLEEPEADEDLPAIVHADRYRPVPMNMASTAPTRIVRDENGDATDEVYGKVQEAVFDLLLLFTDEDAKEDCYEAVRTYFEKYEASSVAWDPTGIQSDVKWVRVDDANTEDDSSAQPARRGDRLRVRITFLREYLHSGTHIDQVDHEVDADNDGTTDATFTTT